MVTIDKAVIARLTSHGHHFEVLVDCDTALLAKQGKNVDVHDLLAAQKVFSNAHKGLLAPEKAVLEVFGSDDALTVALAIIKKGELQLTREYHQKLKDQKRRQIVHMLHVNGVDPKTHAPHPMERLESALDEVKFQVDEHKSIEEQVQLAITKLRAVLPLKFEVKVLEIKITPTYGRKAYTTLKKYGTITEEHWQENGYFHAMLEIPGGLEADFYTELNAICHGEAEVTVKKTK